MTRRCVDCGRAITACNGFCWSNDIVAMFDGKITAAQVREYCGRCALKHDPELKEDIARINEERYSRLGVEYVKADDTKKA